MNGLDPILVVVSIVSVVAARVAGVALVKTAGFHEPPAEYILDFHQAKIANQTVFFAALADSKIKFRHNRALGDGERVIAISLLN